MSIARVLDGKLSATLALIVIIGWLVVDVVEGYPVARPDFNTVVIIISLAGVAFLFYHEDRAASKDPVTQKAQIEASVELFLDRLAKYQSISTPENTERFEGLDALLRVFRGAPVGDVGELPKIITDDREEEEAKEQQAIAGGGPW